MMDEQQRFDRSVLQRLPQCAARCFGRVALGDPEIACSDRAIVRTAGKLNQPRQLLLLLLGTRGHRQPRDRYLICFGPTEIPRPV